MSTPVLAVITSGGMVAGKRDAGKNLHMDSGTWNLEPTFKPQGSEGQRNDMNLNLFVHFAFAKYYLE